MKFIEASGVAEQISSRDLEVGSLVLCRPQKSGACHDKKRSFQMVLDFDALEVELEHHVIQIMHRECTTVA